MKCPHCHKTFGNADDKNVCNLKDPNVSRNAIKIRCSLCKKMFGRYSYNHAVTHLTYGTWINPETVGVYKKVKTKIWR